MPKIPIIGLKGFTSQADALVAPQFAKDCNNVIFDKGDLCNLPYTKSSITSSIFSVSSDIVGGIMFRGDTRKRFFLMSTSTDSLQYRLRTYVAIQLETGWIVIPNIAKINLNGGVINPKYRQLINGVFYKTAPRSNFVQVGEWLLHLGLFSDYEDILIDNELYQKIPRMVRFRETDLGSLEARFIGIASPREVTKSGDDTTLSLTHDTPVRFGFTFVSIKELNADNENPVDTQVLQVGDIESNVTAADEDFTTTGDQPIYSLFLKSGLQNIEPTFGSQIIVGIYIRPTNQTDFQFLQYKYGNFNSTNQPPRITVTVTESGEGDATKIGAQTDVIPIEGSRDVPRPAWHGIHFKNRMYYASIRKDVFNILQYSQLTASDDPDQGEYANYIEGEISIGLDAEAITGFLVYRNQLIVFKESETYILTDDPKEPGMRVNSLFTDKGCVGRDGGHAYLAEGDAIYWVAKEGVYKFAGIHSFSGASEPELISKPISEELRNIDRMRYSVCRLSIDSRYGHLYLTFPKGSLGDQNVDIPTYIYHIREEGDVWTKIDPIIQLVSSKINLTILSDTVSDVFTVKPNSLDFLKDIDEDANEEFKRSWFYHTVNIVAGNFDDTKHWKFFNIYSLKDLILDFAVSDEKEELFILESMMKRIRLGVRGQFINVKFGSDTEKAFRIKGYEIDVHITRKR